MASEYETSANGSAYTESYTYDGLRRLTGTVSNDWVQGTTYVATYAYDAAGNRTQWTGNDNRQTDLYYDGFVATYSYNSANQLTALDWNTNQSAYNYEESYRYDANGNRTHSERTDHTQVGGHNYGYVWGQEWGYDRENHLTSQTNYRLDSDGTRTDYDRTTHQYDVNTFQYDEVGNLLASEQANGSQTAYQYDAAYRLLGVTTTDINGAVSARASYTLDSVGQRVASEYETSANGSAYTESYTYDGLRRLTGTVSNDWVQGTTYVATYAYDAAGNRTQWTGNDNRQTDLYYDGFVATYSYNSANQLTALDWNTNQSAYNYEESYRYDANGNRTHSERTDHTQVGGHNYGYVWGQEWGYDRENHLTSQTNYRLDSDGTRTDYDRTTHQYDGYPLPFDARGRRLVSEYQRDVNDTSVDSERNEFMYSGLDLLAEYWLLDASTPSAGSLDSTPDTSTYRTEYTLANLQPQAPGTLASQAVPIARTEYPTDGSISHLAQRTDYFHPDGRGNVAGYTNGDGYTQQTYAYDAFGQELPNAASGDAGRAERDLNNIRFASKPASPTPGAAPSERDTLQYYGARYYDNALAQWATADSYRGTLSLPETLHRYAFVGNSPTAGGEWYGWCDWWDVGCHAQGAVQAASSAVRTGTQWAVEHRDQIAVGVAIGAAVVATVATGGAAAPLLVGAIAAGAAVGATVAINAADKHVLGNQERSYFDGALQNGATGFFAGTAIGQIGQAVAVGVQIVGTIVGALSADGDPTNEVRTASDAIQQANQNCGGDYCASEVGDAVQSVTQNVGKTYSGGYTVYQGVDPETGIVKYVGITGRVPDVRFLEHKGAIGTGRELLEYEIVESGLSSELEARILEQIQINTYGLAKNGGQLLNKINSIAEKYWELYGICR
ncbi:MAG TPA: hypothetical protein PK299_05090 [Anaerolineales bacterium]|nr:hypothetical protein [Anaerolineales bacterium]